MKNEIYEKATTLIKEAEEQMKAYLAENSRGHEIIVDCSMSIHNIPEGEMPKGSEENFSESGRYYVYHPTLFGGVTLFSKSKKGKFVFDETPNPETSNQQHETK